MPYHHHQRRKKERKEGKKMGLAAERTKQRFGLDPRNTLWSNDTSRFGHQQLQRFGWRPGMGLGADPTKSRSTHIRVRVKDDMLGLGSRLKKKQGKKGGGDVDVDIDDDTTGLDVFQRILGRLNGKGSDSVERELEIQKRENYIGGRWGVHFVKGDVLASTWDPVTKKLKSYSGMGAADSPLSSSSESEYSDEEAEKKEKKKSKKKRKHHSDDSDDTSSSENGEDKVESKKKSKRDKKDKKRKESKENKKVKKAKKIEKKQKKLRLREQEEEEKEEEREGMLTTSSSATSIPDVVSTRLSARSRWIRQKKAALMDQKALSEIFMIRTPSPQPSVN